jgi:hypothetical protein
MQNSAFETCKELSLTMEESLNKLKEWNLYQAYGKFNISYEELIDKVRDCIRLLIHKYYNTEQENLLHRDYSSQFSMKHDEVPESLVDRPLKIVISELTGHSIIQCLRGLLFELRAQNILSFTDEQAKEIITTLCNKLIEANELRNRIIHSTSHVWSLSPFIGGSGTYSPDKLSTINENNIFLFSRYEKVSKSGYDYQIAKFEISDLEIYNEQIGKLNHYVFALKQFIVKGTLQIKSFERLSEIELKTKHISHKN